MSKIFPSGKAAEAKAESSKSQFATSRLTISIVRILQARCRLLSPRRWSGYFGVCDLVAFFFPFTIAFGCVCGVPDPRAEVGRQREIPLPAACDCSFASLLFDFFREAN